MLHQILHYYRLLGYYITATNKQSKLNYINTAKLHNVLCIYGIFQIWRFLDIILAIEMEYIILLIQSHFLITTTNELWIVSLLENLID